MNYLNIFITTLAYTVYLETVQSQLITKEKLTLDDLVASMDYMFNVKIPGQTLTLAMLTGSMENLPMSTILVNNNGDFLSDAQQANYALKLIR